MTDTRPTIHVLATGGTIAGEAGHATRRDYRPGQIAIADFLGQAEALGLEARLTGAQIANIGSEDIGPQVWGKLHAAALTALADPAVEGIVITHGTDTAEETALLLDLTLPATKPVVLVGAMRPADAVGTDGLRNFANAVRVAANAQAGGRGVLVVMGDSVIAARDVRKARTGGGDAFRGFPRSGVAAVTPGSLEWFGPAWRMDSAARYDFPQRWPRVPVIHTAAGMALDDVRCLLADARGVVVAGMGSGNMPDAVRGILREAAAGGIPVVRSTRVDQGLVDREEEDDANGFVAARALGPAKARMLLQVLLANGCTDPAAIQDAFDTR